MEIGGAERTVLEITSFLKDKEFSSLVLTSGGKLIGELEKENIEEKTVLSEICDFLIDELDE